jgi:cytochrome c oxidase cbb3-type subunit 3
MDPGTRKPEPEGELRPHAYDGIREYDKRLPNWWLFTLYLMIVFWLGYWAYYERFRAGPSGPEKVERELARIEASKLAAIASSRLDDATLWKMSRNPEIVATGRATFESMCVSCHKSSLRGVDEGGIGADLRRQVWIHGGRPMDLLRTATSGVPVKGMPTWGPILGQKKLAEAVAYILSYHQEGEPMSIQTASAPRT